MRRRKGTPSPTAIPMALLSLPSSPEDGVEVAEDVVNEVIEGEAVVEDAVVEDAVIEDAEAEEEAVLEVVVVDDASPV